MVLDSTASSILDPVTGLPLDQYSGIIQQIPLGQQVFPLADLDADGRMMRQPIYGDDVIPTSALVVGQDSKGVPRAGTMDSARRLYTREAVFQSGGAPIKDGTTAPVDVNVVGGGGGGGGLWTPKSIVGVEASSFTTDDIMVFNGIQWKTMTTVYAMDVYIEMTDVPQASSKNRNYLGFTDAIDHDPTWWAFAIFCGPSPAGIGGELPYNTAHFDFGAGLNIATYLGHPLADGVWVHMNNKQAPVHAIVTLYGD